ncbi:Fur family peroxide stress response transcriptional regulator [Anoxybacillus vitaminiphilus]|uniref:Fur family peroxide stress response transcriptional regulator n=1 Tax=Paranoxybacillus vitaminiphilus TaxID=581036 RepID=A0A327YBH9_9BACL|nr:transcriptional repressor [Anoxybacillus vitaminiphilus]RAK18373.1 Fur family peroxide stress response transcriptional regulator [Anoxybacillus vitaminiphilus]
MKTAEELYKLIEVKLPTVSLATIYNNLKLFLKHGIVKDLPYENGLTKYEWNSEKEHYHVTCTICGKMKDFYYPVIKEVEFLAESISKYKVHKHHLQFFGICNDCAEQEVKRYEKT